MPLPWPFRMASLLDSVSNAIISLFDAATRFERTTPWKLGYAIAAVIASTATVTMSSINVNPRVRTDIRTLPSVIAGEHEP